jgi:hypothetical protein
MAETYANKLYEIFRDTKQTEYHSSLGSFVDQFSSAEKELQLTLQSFSKMKPKAAKAVFSGTRVADGVSLIKRLMEVKPLKSKKKQTLLIDVLDQLKAINDARNLILHYGGQWQDGHTWLVTTESVAHTERTVRELKLTLPRLAEMRGDLIKIRMHLIDMRGAMPAKMRGVIQDVLSASWFYIRPGQPKQNQGQKAGRKGRHRSKRPQRKPSQVSAGG